MPPQGLHKLFSARLQSQSLNLRHVKTYHPPGVQAARATTMNGKFTQEEAAFWTDKEMLKSSTRWDIQGRVGEGWGDAQT